MNRILRFSLAAAVIAFSWETRGIAVELSCQVRNAFEGPEKAPSPRGLILLSDTALPSFNIEVPVATSQSNIGKDVLTVVVGLTTKPSPPPPPGKPPSYEIMGSLGQSLAAKPAPPPPLGKPSNVIRNSMSFEDWQGFRIHIETAPIDGRPDHSVVLEKVTVSVVSGDGKTLFSIPSLTNIPRGSSHVFGLEVSAATAAKYFVRGNRIEVFAQTSSPAKGWVRFGFSSQRR